MNVLCISLGCDKNLVDSEMMLGLLNQKGYSFTSDEQEADIILINTCCFIGDAKEESVNTILEMAELKKQGRLKALIVTGCLAQRYKQEILDEIPEVDGILGTAGIDEIAEEMCIRDRIMSTLAAGVTFINAVAGTVVVVAVYSAIRPILKRTGLFFHIR